MELMSHDGRSRRPKNAVLCQVAMDVAHDSNAPPPGLSGNEAGHLVSLAVPFDLSGQVHQASTLGVDGQVSFVRLLQRTQHPLVLREFASIKLRIASTYVDSVHLWQGRVVNRAEGHDF